MIELLVVIAIIAFLTLWPPPRMCAGRAKAGFHVD
ncbi:MAG: type II secretion system protein [Planctomycetia bacterium]|nr:type II secretion system protein [Planctomycetia bacterium]